ncbi:hypothetical protein C1646_616533, partial [Rhizophagus diaphanus]
LPLSLLNTAQGHPMLVELKNGETFNGHLVNCDNWMNLTLREVIQTSPEGDRFWRLPECYIRGNTIKYLRVPDEVCIVLIDLKMVSLNHYLIVLFNISDHGNGKGGYFTTKTRTKQWKSRT